MHFEKHQGPPRIVYLTFAHVAKHILCTQAGSIKPKVKHGKEVFEAEQILRYVWEIQNVDHCYVATTQFCLTYHYVVWALSKRRFVIDPSVSIGSFAMRNRPSCRFFLSWKASFVSCGKVILVGIMIHIKNNMKIVSFDSMGLTRETRVVAYEIFAGRMSK